MSVILEKRPFVVPEVAAFDTLAADYDRDFTYSLLGRLMRVAVWRRMDAHFDSGDHILELNCGTGEDAIHLARRGTHVLATDLSATMVQAAREKVARCGLEGRVAVRRMAIESLAEEACFLASDAGASSGFDGALSNFGGLNCVEDLEGAVAGLAACLRPGAIALLCVMGPFCPWEWAWYLWRRQPAKAFRRFRRCGTVWRGLTIRYPSLRAVRSAFAPEFRLRRVAAVGALLPPSYAEGWARRHERLICTLNRWERRLESLPPLPWLSDHYLLELERSAGQ